MGDEDKMSRSYDHHWLKTNLTELSQKQVPNEIWVCMLYLYVEVKLMFMWCFPQVWGFYCPERKDKASVNTLLHNINAALNYQWWVHLPLFLNLITDYDSGHLHHSHIQSSQSFVVCFLWFCFALVRFKFKPTVPVKGIAAPTLYTRVKHSRCCERFHSLYRMWLSKLDYFFTFVTGMFIPLLIMSLKFTLWKWKVRSCIWSWELHIF